MEKKTEKQLIEAIKALRRSEKSYRLLMDNLQDLICLTDKEGVFQYVSPSYRDELGYAPEDLLGKSAFTWVHPDDLENVRERFQSLVKTGITQKVSFRCQSATGEYLWFQSRGKPVRDPQGELIGVGVSNRDITERKLAEEALKQANLVVENSPVVLFRWKATEGWPVEMVSQNVSQFGYTPEELLSGAVPFAAMVYADDLDRLAGEVQEYSASGADRFQQEYRIVTKDGKVRWVDDRTVVERNVAGQIVYYQGIVIDITERKRMETALKKRENELTLLTDNMLDMISFIDRDRIIRYVSPSIRLILGCEPEELIGRPALELVHPDDRERLLNESCRARAENAQILKLEYRYRRAAGDYLWLESLCRFILDDQGQLEGTVFSSRDMSVRRQMEEDLRRSESQYRLLAENTSDVVWLVDLATQRVEYTSPSVERLRGYSPEEVMSQSMSKVLTPESYQKIAEILSDRLAAFATGDESLRAKIIEVDQPCKNGRIISTEIMISLITGEDGRVAKIAGSSRDITQRKKLEAALRKSRDELEVRVKERTAELEAVNTRLQREIIERVQAQEEAVLKTQELTKSQARLQSVFDGITDPLVMLDQDLKVIMLNRAAQAYFGKNNIQEVIQPPCFEAFGDTGNLRPEGPMEQAVSSGRPFQYERTGLMDPNRWENVMLYPLREEEEGQRGIILRIADITEKKMSENQLVQRQKMEALGILISGIAHEINNPNNFISFNMPILRDYLSALLSLTDETAQARTELVFFGMTYPEFREDVFRLLENVRNGSDRINAIVSQLKTFSRKKGGLELRETDLGEVVDRVFALSRNQLRKTVHSLEVDLADNLPPVRTDPEALGQVLLNLLINGAQAADKPDSWIKVTVDQRPDFPRLLIIEVADNGCGIEAEILGRIFNPFFTTKKVGEGTGLGLYVCQNLVENLGGWIEVQSQPGVGSQFQVFLPV